MNNFQVEMSVFILFLVFLFAKSAEKFKDGKRVTVFANHIGPIVHNPQETYHYFDFPFCKPSVLKYEFPTIGEALQGMELVETVYEIDFKQTTRKSLACAHGFNKKEMKKIQNAIKNEYWYEFYLDGLPLWGVVGKYDENQGKYYIYTHKRFILGYNGPYLVEVNVEPQRPILLETNTKYQFTYSVDWIEQTNIPVHRRFERYLDNKFFEHKIHWFSIINSFLLVLFFLGVSVMVLMRTIRNELQKEEILMTDLENGPSLVGGLDFINLDESAWKKLSGDVFRRPPYVGVLSALLGSGGQLLLLVFGMIFFAIVTTYYDEIGSQMTSFIILYVLTSIFSGFLSGSFYIQNGGKSWIRTSVLTSVLFPSFCVSVYGVMNLFALMYKSSQSIPFLTIFLIFVIHFFITTPLIFVGTVIGRQFHSDPKYPCRTNILEKLIPQKPFYAQKWFIMMIGGLIPYLCIFVELYYIFSSFQSYYKIYYVYGFFLVVFIMLLMITVCLSIVFTYILLISEDWKWAWNSYFCAFSTGVYTFIYSFIFYEKTKMTGIFQFVFYISHTLLFSVGIGMICGAVSFYASRIFVKRIFKGMKFD